MSILPDWQIRRDIKIEPFAESAVRPGVISYGVSSYGYDVRVGRKFKVFTNVHCAVVDPKRFDPTSFVDIEGDSCLIPPNSFALAETVEYLEIPRDILGVCVGKSTYARCGICGFPDRSEEHTSELQSHHDLVCRLLLEKKKKKEKSIHNTRRILIQGAEATEERQLSST